MRTEWNPDAYLAFNDLRLRPALDLIAALPAVPPGDIVDLGCGAGTVGAALAGRFRGHRLIGVDLSETMLERARRQTAYDRIERADVATWTPDRRPALIFSNAVLQWLPEHGALLPRLARELQPAGVLAIQMPRQSDAPAQSLLRTLSETLFPERFDWSRYESPVSPPEDYVLLLASMGQLRLWETTYYQRLTASDDGHPIRLFSQSTAARPILEQLSDSEAARFLSEYDAALSKAYVSQADGSVLYPFRRLFLLLQRSG